MGGQRGRAVTHQEKRKGAKAEQHKQENSSHVEAQVVGGGAGGGHSPSGQEDGTGVPPPLFTAVLGSVSPPSTSPLPPLYR